MKFWWYLLLTSSMLLHGVIMTSYCCQQYTVSGLVTTSCSSRTAHRHTEPRRARSTVELLRQETPNFLAPNMWPPNSPSLSPVGYEIWAVIQHRVLMNWNGGSSMSGAVFNSRFLTRLLTSRKEDIKSMPTLKEDISSTACELTMLILSTPVTFMWFVWLLHL